MKKRLILIGVAFFVFVTHGNAQLLWKVDGNGLKEASYIFGTHHIAPLGICDSIAGFDAAFNSCKQLYGEVVMSDMQAAGIEMMKYMMLPQDSLLDTFYSEEEYKLIDDILKTYMGVGADQLKMLKPAAISANLSVMIAAKTFNGYDPNKQLDATMQARAKEKGMTVKGFETVLYQIELLFGTPNAEQAADLLKMLKNHDKMESFSKDMADAYLGQDLDKLFKAFDDPDMGATEDEMKRLVYDRNHNWAKQAKTIFEKPTFIVVGAGHLPGDQGLIELLRMQGYSVAPVE